MQFSYCYGECFYFTNDNLFKFSQKYELLQLIGYDRIETGNSSDYIRTKDKRKRIILWLVCRQA